MATPYSLIENVKVNKLAKADYDLYVATGIITPEMIANEVWIFTDDSFLSAENLAKLEAFLPTDYYKKSEVYSKTEVQSLMSALNTLKFQIVDTLPTENIDAKTIYLTAKADSESGNAYDENIYINGAWEVIGDTTIDLSDYYKKSEADAKFMTDYTETDPTVPAWAKAANKPSYTASEVGALPANTSIPTKLSDLSADVSHRTVTDAEKEAWNGKAETRIWNPAE